MILIILIVLLGFIIGFFVGFNLALHWNFSKREKDDLEKWAQLFMIEGFELGKIYKDYY